MKFETSPTPTLVLPVPDSPGWLRLPMDSGPSRPKAADSDRFGLDDSMGVTPPKPR